MLRIKYAVGGKVQDLRTFENREEFVDWLHRQLFIEPITLLDIEEVLD